MREQYSQVTRITPSASTISARSGAGKSYLAKLELLRSLHRGVEVAVVDPEDEYTRLADAVGGRVIRLGAGGVRLNPFDLPLHAGPDGRRIAARDQTHDQIRVRTKRRGTFRGIQNPQPPAGTRTYICQMATMG